MLFSHFEPAGGRGGVSSWLWAGGTTLGAALLVFVALWALHRFRLRRGLSTGFPTLRRLAPPLCALSAFVVARTLLPRWALLDAEDIPLVNILGIFLSAWAAIALVGALRHWLYQKFDVSQADNLKERRILTQLQFMEQIVDLGVVIAAVAAALYQVSWGRTIGTSLLASAGVASVIIGLGAQRTVANLIAGFQIAFTQPLRLGDAVVVESEWGWVEEINLTYVVIRIWDSRRLVLPITYFIEKPFQNWTRSSGQILGSVHLTVSHNAPFEAIESKLFEVLDSSERWDGDARVLQVVESNEHSVVLRALMTAKDSPTCWDLRCEVRRALLEYLAQQHPDALPSVRLTTLGVAGAPGSQVAGNCSS